MAYNESSEYVNNFNIDMAAYPDAKRGYDSTVWTKTSVTQTVTDEEGNSSTVAVSKYVMIAELNSVIPTFDVVSDAPTPTPQPAHFDSDSTNVYYKLHFPSNYGFRVGSSLPTVDYSFDNTTGKKGKVIEKTVSDDEYTNVFSDAYVSWTRDEYNKETGETTTYYYSGQGNWVELPDGGTAPAEVPAAIQFNRIGFDKNYNASKREVRCTVPDSKYLYIELDTPSGASIQLKPTGKSGHSYDEHGETNNYANDIQELEINLADIGNALSDF